MKNVTEKIKLTVINLLIAALLVAGIGFGILQWLDNYTDHGVSILVPDFSGFTPEEAREVARHERLDIQVIDSIYDKDAAPGSVVEQYPAGGEHVKEGRTIRLTINARTPEKVVFPSLRNAAYRQTLQMLESRGFRIGHIEYVPSEYQNLVLQLKTNGEEVEAGTLLPKGTVIDIVLGSGNGNTFINIPVVKGRRLQAAIDILRDAYLNIGNIIPDGSITPETDRNAAFVYLQSPTVQIPVERGTPVNLYITLEEEKATTADSLLLQDTLTTLPQP